MITRLSGALRTSFTFLNVSAGSCLKYLRSIEGLGKDVKCSHSRVTILFFLRAEIITDGSSIKSRRNF